MYKYLWAIPLLAVALIVAGCHGEGVQVRVTVTTPAAGASEYQGTPVNITATVTASAGVNKVEFRIDGVLAATDTTAPFSYLWDTSGAAIGDHTISVTAYDMSTPTRTAMATRTIAIEQPPTAPPTVQITSPQDGDTVTGSIDVTANATAVEPGATITKIDIILDGITKTITGASGTKTFDTTQVSNGARTIVAVATDSLSVTGAHTINVTVDNPVPTVNITDPAGGTTVSGVLNVTCNAAVGIPGATIDHIDVTLASSPVTKTITGGSGTVSFDTTQFTNGAHTITAVATDSFGLIGQASINVTVDNFLVYAEDRAITSGGTGTVSVKMTDTSGVAGFQMTINYDPNDLVVVGGNAGVTAGAAVPAGTLLIVDTLTAGVGVITVAVAGVTLFDGAEDEILAIAFQAIGGAGDTLVDIDDTGGATTLLKFSDETGTDIVPQPAAVDGTVTIQ